MKRGTDPDVHTTGLLLDDTKIFVLFPFELHIGYHVMPWYPTLAYTSFVRLFDKLDVIDRNASIESGAYVSQLSAAAHARAASRKPVSKSDRNSSLESSDSDLLPVMLVWLEVFLQVFTRGLLPLVLTTRHFSLNDLLSRRGCKRLGRWRQVRNAIWPLQPNILSVPLLLMPRLLCPLASCPPFIESILNILYKKHLLRPTSVMATWVQKSWSN